MARTVPFRCRLPSGDVVRGRISRRTRGTLESPPEGGEIVSLDAELSEAQIEYVYENMEEEDDFEEPEERGEP